MKCFTAVIEITCIISLLDVTLTQRPVDCPRFCAQNYQPVCGSNSKTYGNECELNAAAECSAVNVIKVHDGPCGGDDETWSSSDAMTCEEYPCQNGGSCVDYGSFVGCSCLKRYTGEHCEIDRCPFACAEIYHPVCGSDGKTYANDCEFDSQSECYDESLYKRSDGECLNSVTVPAGEELWCPQEYPDDLNASLAEECNRNKDCVPGHGCCYLQECPSGKCCVELVKEPADCLEDDYSIYGVQLSLRHGESQYVGDSPCPPYCFCENGHIRCAVASCYVPGNDIFLSVLSFVGPILLIIVIVAILVCTIMACRHRKRARRTSVQATESKADKPPAYGEVVPVQPPSPSVGTNSGKAPPTYDQAINMA